MPRRKPSKFQKLGNSKVKPRGSTTLDYDALASTPTRSRGSGKNASKKRARPAEKAAASSVEPTAAAKGTRASSRRGTGGTSKVLPAYPKTRCPSKVTEGIEAFTGPNADAHRVHHVLNRIVENECNSIQKVFAGADATLCDTSE
tara:strand:- start:353 stop:787 length:435 start_codon:yes stop_codon:yes gene_type:complete